MLGCFLYCFLEILGRKDAQKAGGEAAKGV